MTETREMNAPDARCLLDEAAQGVIGRPLDRPDGPLKVTGQATYAHEWNLPGAAYGVLVRATISTGLVTHINETSIADVEGLLGVFHGPEFLRNPAQGMAKKAPVQHAHRIAYFGQPIALVVAETFEAARDGAERIAVDYEASGDGVFDPEAAETERPESTVLEQGDLDAAMARAAFVVDAEYTTPGHSSAPMEPHCSIAEWDGDRLTLRGSYQIIGANRLELADAFGLDPANVRILSPFVGGAFGSKLGIAPEAVAASFAARALARPVCVAMTRQHVFEMTMRRSESRQRVRLAADAEGRLIGLGHSALVSNLPGESFFEPVLQATHFLYGGENRAMHIDIARINRTCAGSVRAPGEAIGMQALENAMDELAEKAGIDPVELRKRNIPERHPETGIPYASRKLAEALDAGAEAFGWSERAAEPGARREGEWLIGMGMATAARVNFLQPAAARVTLRPDGTALVETDMTDIGTGSYAILTQIAAEMLGLPIDRVETRLGDTDLPQSSGSGGSFGAASSGSAVFIACEDLRKRLAAKLGCRADALLMKDGVVICDNRSQPLSEALAGERLVAESRFKPGKALKAKQSATYGAHFAEVAVNAVTGETRVRRMLGAFNFGRILNEKTARSQCIGGMAWGIGMALTETLEYDLRDGHLANRDLAEYHVPVNLDVPQIDVLLVPDRDPDASPIQARGVGELGICGAAAAVTNAIYNATGVRVRNYPATLDRVLAGLG